jgi:WD40 repeat protein
MLNNIRSIILFFAVLFIIINPGYSQVNSKFKMTLQTGNPGAVSRIVLSRDGSMFATSNIMNKTIKIWSNKAKLLMIIDNGEDINNCEMAFSNDNKYLAFTNYTYFKICDLTTGKIITARVTSDAINRIINGIAFSNDGMRVYVGSSNTITTTLPLEIDKDDFEKYINKLNSVEADKLKNNYVLDKNNNKYKLILEIPDHSDLYEIFTKLKVDISKFIPLYSNCIEEWDINGNYLRKIAEHNNVPGKMIAKIVLSPDGKNILSAAYDGLINIWNLNGNLLASVQGSDTYINIGFSTDGKLFGWTSYNGIKICNLNGVYLININRTMSGPSDIDFEKKMFIEYAYDVDANKNPLPIIRQRDFNDQIKNDIKGVSSAGYSIRILPGGKLAVCGNLDGIVNIVNVTAGYTVSMVNSADDWLTYTPDGYWDSSKNGGKLVAMVKDLEAYSVDQFAAKFNRPDIILKRLDTEDDEVINYYYYQYKKRLKKLNLNENNLSDDLKIPEVKIIDSKTIKEKFLELEFNLNDAESNLKSYNIYVNDVPLFGAYGRKVDGKNKTLKEVIELNTGTNKIEITCLNDKGAESFRAMTMAEYNKKVKGDLYYIGFGVSKYKDTSLNLEFADKDAYDMENLFKKMKGYYTNVYTKTFVNDQVTVENIRKAKSFLNNAKVDDTFVLFIAGHGLHDNDEEATYYFLTYDTDLKNLSKTSANFDLIEDLLHGIACRDKLFLMDTCGSGEADDDDVTQYIAMAKSKELKARAVIRGMKIITATGNELKRPYLLDNDRYINNDLVRRSGAIVFSSCKGGEFSYESDALKNGIFTKKIIEALTEKNNMTDNVISINDLVNEVKKTVSDITSGKQNPTVDRDNIYIKFGLPKVK